MADNMFSGLYPMDDSILHPTSSFEYFVTLDIPTAIIFSIFLALFFFTLYNILSGLLQWLMEELPGQNNDLEEGHLPGVVSSSSQIAAFFQVMVQNNLHVLRILETFTRDIEERQGNRFEGIEKSSLPLMKYGSHGVKSCGACAICLEDFHLGESCHVFPGCNHIFHSDCINGWLKNKLTCPICRSSLYKDP